MHEYLRDSFVNYRVALEPDRDEPEWWAGAPSVVRAEDGTIYMAARMRSPEAPPGFRGYEIRILESEDGIHFKPIHAIRREDVPVRGFERPALLIDPKTGLFRLYACTDKKGVGWCILKFQDAPHPSKFVGKTAQVVLEPPPADGLMLTPGYKDPFVLWAEGRWHMYVIGIDRVERMHHFTSHDGIEWEADSRNPIFDNGGWHNFYTRPACVIPMGVGYLFVYEGSNSSWHEPNYNMASGLAYSIDLSHVTDLTPDEPLFISATPGECHMWRYSHWLRAEGHFLVYAECSRPNDSNEIRVFHVSGT